MAINLKDIALTRNAGWSLALNLYQDQARTLPMPLSGYTVKAELRSGQSSTTQLLTPITCQVQIPDTGGVILLSLTQAQIAGISASEGWFDVLLAPAAGLPKRLCYAHVVLGDGETSWP